MISEQQQEQASLYVLGALPAPEREAFEAELRADAELRVLVRGLQRTTGLLSAVIPPVEPPRGLRDKILQRVQAAGAPAAAAPASAPGMIPELRFVAAADSTGWKQLPVPGASLKLLSLDRNRGYAVLLGKLEPGTRYPAHVNVGPEDFCILTGDLHVGDRRLGPGDFHHADEGSQHEVNYSVEGCTLVAVLTAEHPLVALAMA